MLERDMKKWMQQAIELATANVANGGGPFGAVIVKNNELVATGVNRVTATNDPTAHAEVVAIRAACAQLGSFQLTDCQLFTSCEPCPMCFGAIYWARPHKVYFGATKEDAAGINFDDSFIYEQLPLPYTKRAIPFEALMREEAQKAFDTWQKRVDKIAY